MEIIRENNLIKVKSAYNADFVKKAHELNGKWEKPYWVFSEDTSDVLNDTLVEIYGEGFEEVPRVTVEIDLDTFTGDDEASEIRVGGASIAYRPSRDGRVRLVGDTFVKAGGFLESGGSAKYPKVTWEHGTVLVAKVPETVINVQGIKAIDSSDDRRAKLEAEKESLLKRIAEIDALIDEL